MGVAIDAGTLPGDSRVRCAEIVAWAMVEEGKVTRGDGRLEHYLVGISLESNPKNWRTEIAILMSDVHRADSEAGDRQLMAGF